jgi:hypothetical protein
MPTPRRRVIVNALAALSGLLVVALHLYAGVLSKGHPVWRPIGEPILFIFFGWIVSVASCVPALIVTRGRSRAAIVALAITAASAALLFAF